MVVIRSERSNVGPQRTLQFLFLIVSILLHFHDRMDFTIRSGIGPPVSWIKFIYTGRPCRSKTLDIDRCLA